MKKSFSRRVFIHHLHPPIWWFPSSFFFFWRGPFFSHSFWWYTPFSWEFVAIKNSNFAILGPQKCFATLRVTWIFGFDGLEWMFHKPLYMYETLNFFLDSTIGFVWLVFFSGCYHWIHHQSKPPFERISRCLFQIFFYVHSHFGKIPILTRILEMGMGWKFTTQIFTIRNYMIYIYTYYDLYGGFLKWWVSPTTMGFPTKMISTWGVFLGGKPTI